MSAVKRITTDKNSWVFTYKVWPATAERAREVRVYQIDGDVTDQAALEDALLELAVECGCLRARYAL